MQKTTMLIILMLLLVGGGGGVVYAFEDDSHLSNSMQVCGDHICGKGEYQILQRHINNAQMVKVPYSFEKLTKPYFDPIVPSETTAGQTRPNYIMDIHIPDHVDYFGVVLSYNDFQLLKNNVGIFAAVGTGGSGSITTTTAAPNMNYCNLANEIWNGQDAAFQAKYSKSLVVPSTCDVVPQPVPEFTAYGLVMYPILFIVMISMGLILNNKSKQ